MNLRTRLEWTLLLAAAGMMVTTMYCDLATDYPLGVCYALGGMVAGTIAMLCSIGFFLIPAFVGMVNDLSASSPNFGNGKRTAVIVATLTAIAGLCFTSVWNVPGGELWAIGGCLLALLIVAMVTYSSVRPKT